MAAAAAPAETRDATEKRVRDAFNLFDRTRKELVDEREIGTIVRALQLNPTEEDLVAMVTEMKAEEPEAQFIKWAAFEPVCMAYVLDISKGRGASEEQLLQAFQVLDNEKNGYLEVDKLRALMTAQGEKLSPEEFENMSNACSDAEGLVFYDDYIALLSQGVRS